MLVVAVAVVVGHLLLGSCPGLKVDIVIIVVVVSTSGSGGRSPDSRGR